MAPLLTFPLPLPPNGPPVGYGWEQRDMSVLSTTTAFNTGIDRRDIFLGKPRCIVCGESVDAVLQHCHVIRDSEPGIWSDLKIRRWIPSQAKDHPRHEPRDGLLMCSNHHIMFETYDFFIRFIPELKKFVFINYSNRPGLAKFHGKAVALDIKARHAPFPSLFIIHEMRVRGFHPFQPIDPDIGNVDWQDWIYSDGVFDESSGSFKQDSPPNDDSNLPTQLLSQVHLPTMTETGGSAGSSRRKLELNANVIADILAATHASPSWKACVMEGTSWTGTAEENTRKYISSFVEPEP